MMMKKLLALVWFAFLVGCIHPSVAVPTNVPPSDVTPPIAASLPVFVWGGDLAGSTSTSQSVSSLTPTGGTASIMPFNATGLKAATASFNIQDSGAVQRFSLSMPHGQLSVGKGDPAGDGKAVLGPMPGFEAADTGLWLITQNSPSQTASSTNVTLYSDGISTLLNAPSASTSFPIMFSWAGGAGVFRFLYDGVNTATLSNQTSANISSFNIGTNKTGGLLSLQAGAGNTVTQFADGTQNGAALGSFLSTVGHIRTPSGLQWLSRNSGNTGNNLLFGDDGANNLSIGAGFSTLAASATTQITMVTGGSTIAIESGTDIFLDETTLRLRNAAHTEFMSMSPAAAALIQFNATNATSGTISWTGAAAANGNTTTITGQAGGGAAGNGGNVNLNGGAASGSGLFGNVQLQSNGTTQLGIGNFGTVLAVQTVAIATGNTTLTAAQYQAPYIVLTGAIGGGAATVIFPNNPGLWQVDCSQVTGASTIAFKSGTATSATITTPVGGTQQVVLVSTLRGSNTIAINL